MAIAGHWRRLTVASARQSVQVSALTKAHGDETADDTNEALSNLLTYAAAQFNIGKNLSDVQLAILAADLLAVYWHWRFDELAYVLREGVRGRWGTSYDRLDAPTVHGWCRLYEKERDELLDHEAQQRHLAHRRAENNRGELLPEASMPLLYLRAKAEACTDERLADAVRYYLAHPDEPQAAIKKQLAELILAERAQFEEYEATRPRTLDEREAAYQQWRTGYLTTQTLAKAAEQHTAPDLSSVEEIE